MIRTLLADDEPLALARLRRLLADEPDIRVVAECADGAEALKEILEQRPELVFLDVQMPELDAFQVLEGLDPGNAPEIVFVTAFSAFALQAFDAHALDYLLKPFDDERFRESLNRARDAVRRRREGERDRRLETLLSHIADRPQYVERIAVRSGPRILFLRAADIDWIEAEGNYAGLRVGGKTHLLRDTMAALERKLDPRHFIRIHRSTIVNIDRILELHPLFQGEYEVRLRDGTRLTSSRGYRDRIQRLIKGIDEPEGSPEA
jgi:two-component system, LytTR family, response regulator